MGQGFFDKLEKAGKGLDESKDIYTLLEINLGGTVGTVYFGDSNLTLLGTYYDGKLERVSSVSRNLHPDKGSYEVSKLEVGLLNYDGDFYTGKWVHKNLIGQRAELKLCIGTTTNTEYRGIIKDYEYDGDMFNLSIEDFTRDLWGKQIPPRTINKDDIPGDPIEVGMPIPWIYGYFRASQTGNVDPPFYRYTWGFPIFKAGTYIGGTNIEGTRRFGTLEFLVAGHPMGTIDEFYVDGTKIGTWMDGGTSKWTSHLSGTFHSVLDGTSNICWLETTHNPTGTSIFHATGWGAPHSNVYGGTHVRRFADDVLHAVKHIGRLEGNQLGTWERDLTDVHRYLDEQMTLKSFIDEAVLMSGDRSFHFDKSGRANFKYEEDWTGSPGTVSFGEDDILSFKYIKDHDELINNVNYYSYWSQPLGVYTTFLKQESNRSQRETSLVKEWKVGDKWHYSSTVGYNKLRAAVQVDNWLRQFQDAPYKVEIEVPMSAASKVDLTDRIEITYEKAPFGGTGGWIERNLRVMGLEQDYANKRTTIDAWSHGYPYDMMGEPATFDWWRLGDGTTMLYDDYRCKENMRISAAGTSYAWGTASDGSNVLFDPGYESLAYDTGYQDWSQTSGIVSLKTNYQLAIFIKPLITQDVRQQVIYSDVDWNNLTDGGFEWGLGTKGEIFFSIYLAGAGTTFWWMRKESQTDIVGTTGWQMVGVAFNARDHYGKFFLNGSSVGTHFRGDSLTYQEEPRGSYVYLGGSPRHVGSFYQGYMGDLTLASLKIFSQHDVGTRVDYADTTQRRMWRFAKHRYGL